MVAPAAALEAGPVSPGPVRAVLLDVRAARAVLLDVRAVHGPLRAERVATFTACAAVAAPPPMTCLTPA